MSRIASRMLYLLGATANGSRASPPGAEQRRPDSLVWEYASDVLRIRGSTFFHACMGGDLVADDESMAYQLQSGHTYLLC